MYPQSNNNNVYPCKPQFYYIKMGFKGVKTKSHVIVMAVMLYHVQLHKQAMACFEDS